MSSSQTEENRSGSPKMANPAVIDPGPELMEKFFSGNVGAFLFSFKRFDSFTRWKENEKKKKMGI